MFKNFLPSKTTSIFKLLPLLMIFTSISFSACKKKEIDAPVAAYIRFINVSPTFATFNIYMDDNKVNKAPLPFGGSVVFAPYVAGIHNVKYTSATSIDPILTKQLDLTANQIHSAYLIDKGNAIDVFMVIDDASITSDTKAFVKFINLSPDAPALDLVVKGGANLVQSKAYKTASNFVQVDPKTYDLEIKDANGVVKTTLTGVEMAKGRYYTIVSRGYLNPGQSDQPFSAENYPNL